MSEMGKAMMGTGEATGEKRAIEAAEAAISNPLLDDVSMRGARGLLISITGGPDLTLYEVDEAATRIREEVDPEANIILGATFDDALEGTMRVSVVATGLALEAGKGSKGESEAVAEEPVAAAPNRAVFGFTGKQTAPVVAAPKKPVAQPAPMAARPPSQPMAPAAVMAQAEEPPHEIRHEAHAEDAAPAEQPAVQRAAAQARVAAPRIPSIDEFPPIAQRQIAAQQSRIENLAEHAARKKKGLFERLASVGLGRKEDPGPAPREPVMNVQAPRQAAPQQRPAAPPPVAEQHFDDDQLDLPAFLRRQAN
jgi:cell division protein FtsZ